MKKIVLLGAITAFGVTAFAACSGDDNQVNPGKDAGTMDGMSNTDAPGSDGSMPMVTGDVQILSVSDWHGQLDPISGSDMAGNSFTYGGLGALNQYFKKDKAANPNTYIVTAGDSWGATPPLSASFNDTPAVQGEDFWGMDIDAIGNHSFDHGMEYLVARINEAKHPFVMANMKNIENELSMANTANPGTVPSNYKGAYTILNKGGINVAFIGIITSTAPTLLFPGALKSIVVQNPTDAANGAAADARTHGANVVVVLAHMGANGNDPQTMQPVGELVDFAKGLQGVDVVMGDHSDVVVNTAINGTQVVENRSKGRTYARTKIHVDKGKVTTATADVIDPQIVETGKITMVGGQPCGGMNQPACVCAADTDCPMTNDNNPFVCCTGAKAPQLFCSSKGSCQRAFLPFSLDANMNPTVDADASALLQPYRDNLSMKFDVKIGTFTDTKKWARDGDIERREEIPLGDSIVDAIVLRETALAQQKFPDSKAVIGITNGGGIRDTFPSAYAPKDMTLKRPSNTASPPWDLVVGDVYGVLPFGNSVIVRQIGADLLYQVLEHSVFSEPLKNGGFLQISGFTFSYSLSATAGQRVQSVNLTDASKTAIPNDPNFKLTLVTNDFTNAGGDGYTMLKEQNPSPVLEIMADVYLDYIQNVMSGTVGPITGCTPAQWDALGGCIANRIVQNP